MSKLPHKQKNEYSFDLGGTDFDFFMLFKELFPESLLRKIEREEGVTRYRDRIPIFTSTVVIWLMTFQRLSSKHTMSEVVKLLKAGRFEQLHSSDVWQEKCTNISLNTSGYSQARSQLDEQVVQSIVENARDRLFDKFEDQFLWHGKRVWLCDGSSISASHTEDILKAYPASRNHLGASYWPVARVLVMHDLLSGIATTPTWGPMNGPVNVSEQALFKKHVRMLPKPGVIMGDGNFGVFSVGYHAVSSGHDVVLALTEARASSKELLIGITAYSLVRAIIALAALSEEKDPRRLSFSHTLDVIHAHLPRIMKARYINERTAIANDVLKETALCEIPRRKRKRKSQPRILRFRRKSFPCSTKPRKEVQKEFEKMAA